MMRKCEREREKERERERGRDRGESAGRFDAVVDSGGGYGESGGNQVQIADTRDREREERPLIFMVCRDHVGMAR